MGPVLLARSEIDSQLWDECIDRSLQRVTYSFSWYLDTVCEDWCALVWPSANDFQIVMPLPIRKKWSFTIIQQPFFCQYLGLFSAEQLTLDQTNSFLEALSARFSFISSYFFHPENYTSIISCLGRFEELKYEVSETVWLSLRKPFDDIYNGYSNDRKLNLKRSLDYNWVVTKQTKLDSLIGLFKINHALSIRGGVDKDAYLLLEKVFKELSKRNLVHLYYASLEGQIHAGALIVRDGISSIYLFNAADQIGRKGNARTFLLNGYFEKYSETNTYFDFESPQIEKISAFYRSFGGEVRPFINTRKNQLPFPLKQIQILRKWLFKTRQDLF